MQQPKPFRALREFLETESAGGIMLVAAAVLALAFSNSPLSGLYEWLIDLRVAVILGGLELDKPLLLWINDGLMAVFFMLIGLELKREMLEGELTPAKLALPLICAVGGFLVPAAIYVWFNWGSADALNGWAIPAATDIAFALGILSLLGRRVPLALKVFLTSLAVFDDLGAIIVIAIFYSSDLSYWALILGDIAVIGLIALNMLGVRRIAPYMLLGVFLWVTVLKSGVHATLAGVIIGLTIPLKRDDDGHSPLRDLEHNLHPWVAYMILPVFAFANAGVPFAGMTREAILGPVPVGIAVGLFVGKQIGIFGLAWIAIKSGLAKMPTGANWLMLYGVSLLAGIGFTMSLFIGTLAFEHGNYNYSAETRAGVLGGSLLSATLGYLVLKYAVRKSPATDDADDPAY